MQFELILVITRLDELHFVLFSGCRLIYQIIYENKTLRKHFCLATLVQYFKVYKHNNILNKLELVYLHKGQILCISPNGLQAGHCDASPSPPPPLWMTENHLRSHFSPFQINTQLFFILFEMFFKMAIGGHFGIGFF